MDDVNRTDAKQWRVICSPLLCDYQSVTRFALLSLLLSLPACSDDGQDTLDPSTTSGPGSSTGNGSTSEGTTHEGLSSTSGDTEAHGSSETGEALTTGGDTSSTGEPIEATTDSAGVVATTGDETSGGSDSSTGEPAAVCWSDSCSEDNPCAPGLLCTLHPDAVGLRVCSAPCVLIGPDPECLTEPFACGDAVPRSMCLDVEGAGHCLPVLCPGGVDDCMGGEECVDGFCY